MKYTQGKYIIAEKSAIARNIYSFTISCPEIAQVAVPGQFVHIRIGSFTLRRPISICGIDPVKGTLRIVFEIRGEGTSAIADLNKGDVIDMLAPLGHGFTVNPDFKKVILIGGGIGTPPMLPLAMAYGERLLQFPASGTLLPLSFRRISPLPEQKQSSAPTTAQQESTALLLSPLRNLSETAELTQYSPADLLPC